MISENHAVTSTSSRILIGAPIERTIYLHVLGNGVVYIGGADVTTANGMLTEKGAVPIELLIPPHQELWAISGDGTENVRLLRTAADGN